MLLKKNSGACHPIIYTGSKNEFASCAVIIFRDNAGATRTATLYSLAINNINTFSYFKDVIQRVAKSPRMTNEGVRNLLPDRWALGGDGNAETISLNLVPLNKNQATL